MKKNKHTDISSCWLCVQFLCTDFTRKRVTYQSELTGVLNTHPLCQDTDPGSAPDRWESAELIGHTWLSNLILSETESCDHADTETYSFKSQITTRPCETREFIWTTGGVTDGALGTRQGINIIWEVTRFYEWVGGNRREQSVGNKIKNMKYE